MDKKTRKKRVDAAGMVMQKKLIGIWVCLLIGVVRPSVGAGHVEAAQSKASKKNAAGAIWQGRRGWVSAGGRRRAVRVARSTGRAGQNKQKALRLLKRGLAKLKKKKYSAALADLRAGRKLYRHFAFAMFIGACYYHLGKPRLALRYYKKAHRIGGLTPRHKKTIKRYEQMARQRLSHGHVTIRSAPRAGARIFLDGVLVGKTPLAQPLRLERGRHTILLKKQGHKAVKKTITVRGGTRQTVDFILAAHKHRNGQAPQQRGSSANGRKARSGDPTANGRPGPPHRTAGRHTARTTGAGKKAGTGAGAMPTVRRRSRKNRKNTFKKTLQWTALGLAAAGVLAFVPGGVYLGLDGKKASADPHPGYSATRYDTQKLGVGFAVTGSVLLVGAAVCYGLSWLWNDTKKRLAAESIQADTGSTHVAASASAATHTDGVSTTSGAATSATAAFGRRQSRRTAPSSLLPRGFTVSVVSTGRGALVGAGWSF